MKKVALMQPYFFPYIGYFQLISAVDTFVIYDDVQWMKGGWINRNRVLTPAGSAGYLSLPVKGDSLSKNINERALADGVDAEKDKILRKLAEVYKRAPYFEPTMALVERILKFDEANAALFLTNSIEQICGHLNIATRIVLSSEIDKRANLRSSARVIDIAESLSADQYVNAIGGQSLYDKADFLRHGIKLSFLKSRPIVYEQLGAPFVSDLSIIDIMMFNSAEDLFRLLDSYELI
jgi:WbqC-like protein family